MSLKNEIRWTNEKIKTIFLLAILPSDYERYNIKDFFKKLHIIKKENSFSDIKNIEQLKNLFLD